MAGGAPPRGRRWRRAVGVVRQSWSGAPEGAVVPSGRVAAQLVEGERVLAEVGRHGVVAAPRWLEMVGGGLLGLAWYGASPLDIAWLPFTLTALVVGHGAYGLRLVSTDRFAVTDSRVFRVYGVLDRTVASMPISRVLDITVRRPFHLRLLRCGHLLIETAAQEQGLHELRYLPHPEALARTIHATRLAAERGSRAGRRVPRVADHPRAPAKPRPH